ncbi:MAG: ribonuclease HIII [Peptostreptococcaceae bacterium]|jgi:ribonuclease HIII|nr:ribonuclease HIII [Peptostreptococcaceae bacterium]
MDKYTEYDRIKKIAEDKGAIVSMHKEINYGIQFEIKKEDEKGLYRIYQSKKGIKHDLSQLRSDKLKSLFIEGKVDGQANEDNDTDKKTKSKETKLKDYDLIGVDESGKGDLFGPLVIASVYVDYESYKKLYNLGVKDSKTIDDVKILKLSKLIKSICEYSVVKIRNDKYNELYDKIKNLNKLLAWGHARAIENLLNKVDCDTVLSDKFGKEELIKNRLMEKGQNINLHQQTKAESNLAVAAASIIARAEFVKELDNINKEYNIRFPKGISHITIERGKEFVKKYGKEELFKVAKLHFKTIDRLK